MRGNEIFNFAPPPPARGLYADPGSGFDLLLPFGRENLLAFTVDLEVVTRHPVTTTGESSGAAVATFRKNRDLHRFEQFEFTDDAITSRVESCATGTSA